MITNLFYCKLLPAAEILVTERTTHRIFTTEFRAFLKEREQTTSSNINSQDVNSPLAKH